jgi:coronin-7
VGVATVVLADEADMATASLGPASAGSYSLPASCLAWHPTVDSVLVTGHGNNNKAGVVTWRVSAEGAVSQVWESTWEGKAAVEDIAYSMDGRFVLTVGKDKKLRLLSARTGGVLTTVDAHNGVKASRCVGLGDTKLFATAGFTKTRDREIKVWKPSEDGSSITCEQTVRLDTNTGVVTLLYDPDALLLFAAGYNDGTIRVFEVDPAGKKALTELNNPLRTDAPQQDVALVPKRYMQVMDAEVDRILRVIKDGAGYAVVPVSGVVPRQQKVRYEYVEDLYPDTWVSGQPAQSFDDWMGGQDLLPPRASMNPEKNTVRDEIVAGATTRAAEEIIVLETVAPVVVDRSITSASGKLQAVERPDDGTSVVSGSGNVVNTAAPPKEYVPTAKTLRARQLIRSTHFRHVKGRELKKELHYDGYEADQGAALHRCIHANAEYFAVPLQGTGGPVSVVPLSAQGQRRERDAPIIESGAAVCDLEFNPFHQDKLAVGLESGKVRVFSLPGNGAPLTSSISESVADLSGHQGRIFLIRHHPTADGLLLSASMDRSVRLWDVAAGSQVWSSATAHPPNMQVMSASFDWKGVQFATACRDRTMRIFDARSSGAEVASVEKAHAGSKGFTIDWMGTHDRIFTAGFGPAADRECAMWDTRNLSKALGRTQMDVGSGLPVVFYDYDANVAFVAARGDTTVRMYEPVDKPHFLTAYSGGDPQIGLAPLPKRCMDVRSVELQRFVKATASRCVTVSFTVPRTRTEFYQDDIFSGGLSGVAPLTASAWLGGADADRDMVDLTPAGMTPLSAAPKIEKKGPKYRLEEKVETKDINDSLFTRMNSLTGQKSKEDAEAEKFEGVSDSEWDD